MNGGDLKRARERLGLDSFVFAHVLGVNLSTLYRWESRSSGFGADPLHTTILTLFVRWVRRTDKGMLKIRAEHLRLEVASGEALHALYLFLGAILGVT